MKFPQDHRPHPEGKSEWWYLWGKLESDKFLHCAMFKTRIGRGCRKERCFCLHGSIADKNGAMFFDETDSELDPLKMTMKYVNGNFEFYSPYFKLKAVPDSVPIEWKVDNRCYYSIPDLKIECMINGSKYEGLGWFDHEWAESIWTHLIKITGRNMYKLANWDWMSIKLFSGVRIIVYKIVNDISCFISYEDVVKPQWVTIDENNRHTILELPHSSLFMRLKPLYEERIFRPKFGFKYSEVPLDVFDKENCLIGYGMREKTYGGIKINEENLIYPQEETQNAWCA